jgi:hypothetical protein
LSHRDHHGQRVPWWYPSEIRDGTIKGWRLVIDYRLGNAITVRFQYPMPRIDDVLDSVGGARFFSSCDLTSGFWQLWLTDSDVPKTSFRTPTGLYQWRVLPMGLSNSPAVFQRTMSKVFPTGVYKTRWHQDHGTEQLHPGVHG